VVTPRIGKPVEVQALWLNALWIAAQFSPRWTGLLKQGRAAFAEKFWNAKTGALFDVIDVDHQTDRVDETIRPNQIFALGGLPLALIEGEKARSILECVETHLLTPVGLRSLSPQDPAYRGRYEGGVWERDSSYHQGVVWPWLLGPFVEAWVRVHGGTAEIKRQARERFVQPLSAHLDEAGLGHVSEIADGDAPHAPRGCPWQAWSVGELLRLTESVLAEEKALKTSRRRGAVLAA
jgi:glycogen debranching enzyme